MIFSKRERSKYYCAIAESHGQYFLTAVTKKNQQISFVDFCCSSLPTLGENFNQFGLNLAVPDESVKTQTWFFNENDSLITIYNKIHQSKKIFIKKEWVDFERIAQKDTQDEVLVISYHLQNNLFLTPYITAGFHLAALEPIQLVKKRSLVHSWQLESLKIFSRQFDLQHLAAAETTLKLLDRENFYEYFYT